MKRDEIEPGGLLLTRRKLLLRSGTVLIGTTLAARLPKTVLGKAIQDQVAAPMRGRSRQASPRGMAG
jgi:hypothetical protein